MYFCVMERTYTSPKLVSIETGYQKQVVEVLEELLATAKKGEIVSFIALTIHKGDSMQHWWSGCDNLLTLLGGATRLCHTISNRMNKT